MFIHLIPPQSFYSSGWFPEVMTTHLAVTGGGSIGKCARLSMHSLVSVHIIIVTKICILM